MFKKGRMFTIKFTRTYGSTPSLHNFLKVNKTIRAGYTLTKYVFRCFLNTNRPDQCQSWHDQIKSVFNQPFYVQCQCDQRTEIRCLRIVLEADWHRSYYIGQWPDQFTFKYIGFTCLCDIVNISTITDSHRCTETTE